MGRVHAWHFTNGMALRDGTPLVIGKWYETADVRMCESGYHGSRRIIDALQYAPGATISRVVHDGVIHRSEDKLVSSRRMALWTYDATDVLRAFARRCALDVIDTWGAPSLVRRYLETGDESIRAAARNASRGAAWEASRDASWFAASGAAWSAASGAAWSAGRDAAWFAARARQNRRLTRMIFDGRPS